LRKYDGLKESTYDPDEVGEPDEGKGLREIINEWEKNNMTNP
jgi:hypothetical protein